MLSARLPHLGIGNGGSFLLVGCYVARPTADSDLAKIVREHAPSFFSELSEAGIELPAFVRKSFDAFGRCGDLAYGFMHLGWGVIDRS